MAGLDVMFKIGFRTRNFEIPLLEGLVRGNPLCGLSIIEAEEAAAIDEFILSPGIATTLPGIEPVQPSAELRAGFFILFSLFFLAGIEPDSVSAARCPRPGVPDLVSPTWFDL